MSNFCFACHEEFEDKEADAVDIFDHTYHKECKPDYFEGGVPGWIHEEL